jgi:hypothetical protein
MKTTVSWNVTPCILVDIKMEVAPSSQELIMIYQNILRHNAEDSSLEDACYPNGSCCGFPQSFVSKARVISKSGHHHLLPNLSQFTVRLLSYNSKLYSYSLSTDSNVRASIPGKGKIFLFSTASRPALGFTQSPIQWVQGSSFPRSKAAGAWSLPLTSI